MKLGDLPPLLSSHGLSPFLPACQRVCFTPSLSVECSGKRLNLVTWDTWTLLHTYTLHAYTLHTYTLTSELHLSKCQHVPQG